MTIKAALNLHEDAVILLAHMLRRDKSWLYANQNNNLTTKQLNKFRSLINKRANHWPVAYLTGRKEFYGLDFKITKDVLVPRPETEMLVELALNRTTNPVSRIKQVIDIGAGSGCVIVSLAKELADKKIKLFATDISKKSLVVSRKNAKQHGVLDRIKFIRGNLLDPFRDTKYSIRNTLILANLPYLTTKQLGNLTIKHEPKTALSGGPDGLKYFRELFEQLKTHYPPPNLPHKGVGIKKKFPPLYGEGKGGVTFLLEHDPSQKTPLTKLAHKQFPQGKLKFHKDLSGKTRILQINLTVL